MINLGTWLYVYLDLLICIYLLTYTLVKRFGRVFFFKQPILNNRFWHRDTILSRFWGSVWVWICKLNRDIIWKIVHDFDRYKTLFKHFMTHLLGKLGESHGNQRKELLEYVDTKGWESLGEVQSFKMWILETKRGGSSKKGLCLLGRDSRGWETHEWRVFCEQLGWILWNQKRRFLVKSKANGWFSFGG